MTKKQSDVIHILFGATILAICLVYVVKFLGAFLGNQLNEETGALAGVSVNGNTSETHGS